MRRTYLFWEKHSYRFTVRLFLVRCLVYETMSKCQDPGVCAWERKCVSVCYCRWRWCVWGPSMGLRIIGLKFLQLFFKFFFIFFSKRGHIWLHFASCSVWSCGASTHWAVNPFLSMLHITSHFTDDEAPVTVCYTHAQWSWCVCIFSFTLCFIYVEFFICPSGFIKINQLV